MKRSDSPEGNRFSDSFTWTVVAGSDVIDENGHVNNVAYVRWMQEVAVRHSEATGATRAVLDAGATWVVRSHRVEYLRPVNESERLSVETWIDYVGRVKSTRRYRFVRERDASEVARGETLWVCVDAEYRPSARDPG